AATRNQGRIPERKTALILHEIAAKHHAEPAEQAAKQHHHSAQNNRQNDHCRDPGQSDFDEQNNHSHE
ncbi:MAG: hypothetical protein ACC634_09630, partial [Hyphomicrobiales bacterium]